MINKRRTKNKQEVRKKLVVHNYELDYKNSVKKGLEIFNDKNIGEIWTREANFIITKCDFDWKAISVNNNSQTFCECVVFNINSTSYYRASIYINQKMENLDIFHIKERIQQRMKENIEEEDVKNWKEGNHHLFVANLFNSLKGNVTCKLFDSEFLIKISIPIPKKLLENASSIEIDDYDWRRENFNVLTDGQYDDFDGDFDRLDDWRGA